MIEDAEYIRRALDSLRPNVPPAEWEAYEAIALLRLQGYSLEEIAIIKGASKSTIGRKLKNIKEF